MAFTEMNLDESSLKASIIHEDQAYGEERKRLSSVYVPN